MTFPLPALSQKKPSRGGIAGAACPATYQGKLLVTRETSQAPGSAAHAGAASPEQSQAPAGLWGKGRGQDPHTRVEDKRDNLY